MIKPIFFLSLICCQSALLIGAQQQPVQQGHGAHLTVSPSNLAHFLQFHNQMSSNQAPQSGGIQFGMSNQASNQQPSPARAQMQATINTPLQQPSPQPQPSSPQSGSVNVVMSRSSSPLAGIQHQLSQTHFPGILSSSQTSSAATGQTQPSQGALGIQMPNFNFGLTQHAPGSQHVTEFRALPPNSQLGASQHAPPPPPSSHFQVQAQQQQQSGQLQVGPAGSLQGGPSVSQSQIQLSASQQQPKQVQNPSGSFQMKFF